jgi:hypothetical protein
MTRRRQPSQSARQLEDDEETVVAGVGDSSVSDTQKDVDAEKKALKPPQPVKCTAPAPVTPSRPASASSHRSQPSTWQESDANKEFNNPDYAAQMIAKVLKSKYGEDSTDVYKLPVKRAFHHLDWTPRGWISIGEAQKYCHHAARIAGFDLNESALGQIAKEMDANDDNQVSLDELIEFVDTIRLRILEDVIISNSNFAGKIEAGVQWKSFFDASLDESMLPFEWHNWRDSMSSSRVYRHTLLHNVLGQKQIIAPLQTNFTNAAFVATGPCASQTAGALSKWRAALMNMSKEQGAEYTEALNNVLEATAQFHIFDAGRFPTKLHLLDYCSERMNIIPPEQFEDLANCPASDIAELRQKCWEVLVPILGFVYDLKPDSLKQVFLNVPSEVLIGLNSTSPSLSEWRRLRMLERSRRIRQDLLQWDEMKKASQRCQEWCAAHSTHLDSKASSAIKATKHLYQVQHEALQKALIHLIKIEDVSLGKLKRDRFGKYIASL